VSRLCAFVGATLGGSAGWWVGSRLGFATAFFMSVAGTAAGVYAGRRVARDYFE